MSLGQLKMINAVLEMGADVAGTMHDELGALHCAAQTYKGLLGMLILTKKYKLPVNVINSKNATPLHFAVMYKEIKNVEYLIKVGA
jgi:ankyrin repeat protein